MRRSLIVGLAMSSSLDSQLFSKLSMAWVDRYNAAIDSGTSNQTVASALARTMPLLHNNPLAVPFVCRYRQDVIQPLSTQQIHQLSQDLQTHGALAGLRSKILAQLSPSETKVRNRVETSLSKSELEDLYAPYKPPSKGTLEDRIRKESPQLVEAIDELWKSSSGETREGGRGFTTLAVGDFRPHEDAVTLLANRIAAHPETMDECRAFTKKFCSIVVKKANTTKQAKNQDTEDEIKFDNYDGFESSLTRLREHQILAIRRGVDKKVLKLLFEIDNERAQGKIRKSLGTRVGGAHKKLWYDAMENAWTRLLRKRCTTRAWKDVCDVADNRAIQVFCDNLQKALLAPPARPATPILALDPGFKAGIKAALLDENGQLMKNPEALSTIQFVGNPDVGKAKLIELLSIYRAHPTAGETVCVALGNGHGTNEARKLLNAAAQESGIAVDVNLVNEAGASVWSVTESAMREFPKEAPASIAAVSIARRYQNPLAELIKIPPRSLGLGMYQHDFPEKTLANRLNVASVEAVAQVGVDANSCSAEILEKVPGLTSTLAGKIIKARPLRNRQGLLSISGLGPKTFENCAGFIRVSGVDCDPLDRTLCHPESYGVARFLLDRLNWKLDDPGSIGDIPPQPEWKNKWKGVISEAAVSHGISEARVFTILDHLVVSITNPDPRLRHQEPSTDESSRIGSPTGCGAIPSNLTSLEALQKACPVRGILGQVRNVVDFGAFVDLGLTVDGLLHRSKTGPLDLDRLLVGQEIGVDVVGVNRNRVSLALTGLDLRAESNDSKNKKRPVGASTSRLVSKKQRKIAS